MKEVRRRLCGESAAVLLPRRILRSVRMRASDSSSLTAVTNTILLDNLKNPDNRTAWSQYVERYRPIIVGYARKFGLRAADAEDAAQQALMAFSQAYREGKYFREKGRLRDWLFGISRNQILAQFRKQKPREQQVAGEPDRTDFFDGLEDEGRQKDIWDEQWHAGVLRQCFDEVAQEVEPQTIHAFDLFARQGWPAKKVAEQLGISENAVFGAKRRVLGRIRELLPLMQEIW